jgi:DNA polymerase III subunit chi
MASAGLTEVEFHTGVQAPVEFACRLLRKAQRSGARAWVTAPAAVLNELDRALWTFEERDFVPHARVSGAAPALLKRTPLWLAEALGDTSRPGAPRVLVNLGASAAPDFSAIDRLIEIVPVDVDDAQRGRERWRAYKAAGLSIVHHQATASRDPSRDP